MLRSVYCDLRHAIKPERETSWSYNIYYYPTARKKDKITLAYVREYSESYGVISVYPTNIQLIKENRPEVTKHLVRHINQIMKNFKVKFPPISVGFYGNKYEGKNFRLRYYNRKYQAYVIDDYYSTKEGEERYYQETAIGFELSQYSTPECVVPSYKRIYWFDHHSYYNGVIYFLESDITAEVAKDILLHQIEHKIKLNPFLKKRLDDDGREAVDTAITLLKIKGVA
jgi:hypothetical protein